MRRNTAPYMEHGIWELKAHMKGKLTWSSWHEERPSFWLGRQFPLFKMWVANSVLLSFMRLFVLLPWQLIFLFFPYMGSMGNLSFSYNHHLPAPVFFLPWYFSSEAASTSQSACSVRGFLVCKKQHYSNNRRSLSGGRGRRGRCDSWFCSSVFSPQPWLQWLVFLQGPLRIGS